MTLEQITTFIDEKIELNENKVIISFFELKVLRNLKKEDESYTIHLMATRLNNLGYKVYRTGQKYIENGEQKIVERNQFIIALKER